MALLARALRRSRLCSTMPIYSRSFSAVASGSPDICAGLARAEPELPPPQGPPRSAKGLTISSSVGAGAGADIPWAYGDGGAGPQAMNEGMISNFSTSINMRYSQNSLSSTLGHTFSSPSEIKRRTLSSYTKTTSGVYVPSSPGIIYPPKFAPVKQLIFLNPKQAVYEKWDTPIDYLRKNRVYYELQSPDPSLKPLVEPFFRDLARSLVRLVAHNRRLGYDISDSMHSDNLVVSTTHNSFALLKAAYSLTSSTVPFTGYKAAGKVLQEILERVYYEGVVKGLADDIGYVFNVLDRDVPNDKLIVYNAAFLNRAGRIAFSIKLDMFLSHELWILCHSRKWYRPPDNVAASFLCNLPYVSKEGDYPTDKMHPEFKAMRLYLSQFHTKLTSQPPAQGQQWQGQPPTQGQPGQGQPPAQGQPGQGQPPAQGQPGQGQAQPSQAPAKPRASQCQRRTGRWLVALNRHGCMHPKGLQEETVDLLHLHMPLYLPRAQEEVIRSRAWEDFGMENFFPADDIYF